MKLSVELLNQLSQCVAFPYLSDSRFALVHQIEKEVVEEVHQQVCSNYHSITLLPGKTYTRMLENGGSR